MDPVDLESSIILTLRSTNEVWSHNMKVAQNAYPMFVGVLGQENDFLGPDGEGEHLITSYYKWSSLTHPKAWWRGISLWTCWPGRSPVWGSSPDLRQHGGPRQGGGGSPVRDRGKKEECVFKPYQIILLLEDLSYFRESSICRRHPEPFRRESNNLTHRLSYDNLCDLWIFE